MNRFSFIFLFICIPFILKGEHNTISGLDKKNFKKYWIIESEDPEYNVSFSNDTCEIIAPKGLTLWRKEKMSGDITIEYDACIVYKDKNKDRLSDLNCFWMASDPKKDDIWKRMKWRNGIFNNCYSLKLYYMGYGGNYNTTTRFRKYDGNDDAISDKEIRPKILKEYNDRNNLLEPNKWYHIKIENKGNKVMYYINNKKLVDFNDPNPLKSGWFGFRTTLSRAKITNFRYTNTKSEKAIAKWIGDIPQEDSGISFGVPFPEGTIKSNTPLELFTPEGKHIDTDYWVNAFWPDGSVKWAGIAAVIPGNTEYVQIIPSYNKKKNNKKTGIEVIEKNNQFIINTGKIQVFVPKKGINLLDSILYNNIKVGGKADIISSIQDKPSNEDITRLNIKHFQSKITDVKIERKGNILTTVKYNGIHSDTEGKKNLPFTLRMYFYANCERIRAVHSFIYNLDYEKEFIKSLGIRFNVPMREANYNRHIAFSCNSNGIWSEPVQPLTGRRVLSLNNDNTLQQKQMEGIQIPDYKEFDSKNQSLIDNWASWDNYRLSQLTDNSFSIKKRATSQSPWIGTYTGNHSDGFVFAGDTKGGLGVSLKDFWQSYPTSIEVQNARGREAKIIIWLWSPEAEAMDLRHYDKVAHDLNASYEDVQEGMSTPYGIARTHELYIIPKQTYSGKNNIAQTAYNINNISPLICTPEYLHQCQAFGIWSLPDNNNPQTKPVEERLNKYIEFYKNAVSQHKWYGFWNYGDFMHSYDPIRHCWRYDIGGYAWDNTELASNMWLWYSFLRTGRYDIWKMAEAMTRHTGEVDVYHIGPNSGLGSRHNVSHWGCGAKEARISQAAWNRFYYYLTNDERCGDLMEEVKDADLKLYSIDPMRLAEPKSIYPCSAPARLRIGPDWLAYAGNWMTEWERTGNTKYKDKIIAGMKSIGNLPNGLFTGNKALGFNPETGIITYEGDSKLQNTNHLMTIMGGFEVMNELKQMINIESFNKAWLDHALNYKIKALEISKNKYPVRRLSAYAAWQLYKPELAKETWNDLWNNSDKYCPTTLNINKVLPPDVPGIIDESKTINTNDAALWSLDAIYMLETIPYVLK